MKILSFAAGAILVAAGVYAVVGEHMAGTSTDATINARVVTLRAPIEGTVSLSVRDLGARVRAQQPVVEILDTRHDNVRQLDLQRTQTSLQTDLARVVAQIRAVEQAREQVQNQSKRYQEGRVSQVEARVAEARAALDAAQSRLREAESALTRTSRLHKEGLQTAITLDRARSNFEVAQQEVESSKQRIAFLTTEAASAREGVFVGDSYNDAPSSSQRERELDLRLAELTAERQQIEQRITLTEQQVARERVRVNTLTSAVLSAQTPALIWDMLTGTGEYVRRGDELVRLVDCAGLIVTASVSESVFNTLTPGTAAQLRLNGDDRVFNATILRLGGSGAKSLYDNLAIGPSAEHLKRFDITLSVPELSQHADLECAVGRTGRVIFASGPMATIRLVASRFGL